MLRRAIVKRKDEGEKRRVDEARRGKTALPTRDAKWWPTYPGDEGLPVREIRQREALFWGETGCRSTRLARHRFRRRSGNRRSPSSSSRSEARSSDIAEVCSSRRRLSKLFIVDITFYSRRAAAARRPDGASVVSRDGGCGKKEKKKEKRNTDERDTSCMSEFVRLRECETRRAYE